MASFLKNKNDLGKLMILVGVLSFVPIFVLPFYFSEAKYFLAFFVPSVGSMALGTVVCLFAKNNFSDNSYAYTIKRGSLTVLFTWIYAIIIGAIPFLFLDGVSVAQSLFESASGWTTTGFTVIDVSSTPNIFIFHRSFMQFCGGLGFILMMAMIIQNKHSMNLFSFEGHNDQLSPSVIKTSRTVFGLYSVIFVVGVLLLSICGMPFFDSIIHCMSALSTGGFSSKANSLAEYNSLLIELVTVVIMILGMTNFAVLLLLARRKFKQAMRVSEVKFTLIVLAVVIPLVALLTCLYLSEPFGTSLRSSIFNVVSVLSTTGFSTINFSDLPSSALGIIVVIMFIGGAGGSTAGGIKLNRTYLLFRGAGISLFKRLSPENSVDARYYYRPQGKSEIDNVLLRDTYAYAFLYLLIFIVTAFLLCLTSGESLTNAIFESASLSGTVGVSVGIFGASANAGTLTVGIIGMIIARLEINIIIVGVCSLFIKR